MVIIDEQTKSVINNKANYISIAEAMKEAEKVVEKLNSYSLSNKI